MNSSGTEVSGRKDLLDLDGSEPSNNNRVQGVFHQPLTRNVNQDAFIIDALPNGERLAAGQAICIWRGEGSPELLALFIRW